MALRVLALGALMAAVWGQSRGVQAAAGATVIISVMFFLLVEYRHLRIT